jgi:hypothetical protein
MFTMIASFAFGQTKTKSDSILVSRIDLIKQIELNDKRKAQWDYCVTALTECDSMKILAANHIKSVSTTIELMQEEISLLTLAKDIAINTTKLQTEQIKAERRKGNRKTIAWSIISGAVGFGSGALIVLLKN